MGKTKWLEEKFQEIVNLERSYDSFNSHKKIKEPIVLYKIKRPSIQVDENVYPTIDHREVIITVVAEVY